MYKIISLLFFSIILIAQDSNPIIKDLEQSPPLESQIDLLDIEENKNEQSAQEPLDLTRETNNPQTTQDSPDEEINIQEIPTPKETEKKSNLQMEQAKQEDDPIEEINDPKPEETQIQEEIKQREQAQIEQEALEIEKARERKKQAEEARQKEDSEKKAKEEAQKTNPPPVPPKPKNTLQTINPTANPAAPDFFDLNKNQTRDTLRNIGPKELREKIQQCEEREDKNACFDVGMIYYQGRSVYGQQLKNAFYFFDRSCDEKNGFGCYEAGIIGANFKQYPHALVFLEKSCQSGDLRGCKNLGILYYNGWGTSRNANRAAELFNFGCKSGDQSSCQKLYLALGDAHKELRNFVGAKKNYQKGCELGDERSCREMEVMELLQKELYRQNVIQNNTKRRP